MATKIKLVVKQPAGVKTLVFDNPTRFLVGRADDCDLQLEGSPLFPMISRHHCLLDIEPPHVRVRDMGSRNGTYVNGKMIGHRDRVQPPEKIDPSNFPPLELQSGDEIMVGDTVLQVNIK